MKAPSLNNHMCFQTFASVSSFAEKVVSAEHDTAQNGGLHKKHALVDGP